jgi:hypothetical protein
MKIYINRPKNNWLSPYAIMEKVIFWREIDYDEPLVQNILKSTKLGWFCDKLYTIRSFFNRDIKYIHIDPWDAWSLEHTLSPIILPILQELKRVKNGAPFIADEDVPKNLRVGAKGTGNSDVHKLFEDNDNTFFERYDYILDEMIWTFTQLSMDDHEAPFYDHTESSKEPDLNKSVRKLKVDRKGLKAHNARIANGLRLFGKYYRSLWD